MLNTGNILIDANFRTKVSDFGLANKKGQGVGSIPWMAPEVEVPDRILHSL